jgi:hypothetical protein
MSGQLANYHVLFSRLSHPLMYYVTLSWGVSLLEDCRALWVMCGTSRADSQEWVFGMCLPLGFLFLVSRESKPEFINYWCWTLWGCFDLFWLCYNVSQLFPLECLITAPLLTPSGLWIFDPFPKLLAVVSCGARVRRHNVESSWHCESPVLHTFGYGCVICQNDPILGTPHSSPYVPTPDSSTTCPMVIHSALSRGPRAMLLFRTCRSFPPFF